jgi:hypothetical protein
MENGGWELVLYKPHGGIKKLSLTCKLQPAVAAPPHPIMPERRRLTVQELASVLDLTFATVQSAITIDLGLVK